MEKLIHICTAAHQKGYLIGKTDFANGFNSMSRQSMLVTHSALFPEAVDIFNFFYGCRAPCFVFDQDNNILTFFSEEGSRQGCAAGSEAFCLGLTPVLQLLQHKYPEFELRAVVDDIVPIVPAPHTGSKEDWMLLFSRYADFLHELKDLSLALCGLHLNLDKGALLLPPSAPDPTAEILAKFDPSFCFCRDGLIIVGGPVGTDLFVNEFMRQKMLQAVVKLQAIKQLGMREVRAAHRLLVACASKLPLFLASVVPPSLSLPHLEWFDSQLRATFFHVVGDPDLA